MIKDFRWVCAREYRQAPTGKFITNRNGRSVPVTKGIEYVRTEGAGIMLLPDWYIQAEKAVEQEGLTDLLARIMDHCRHLAWLKNDNQIREYALECLCNEAYKAWEEEDKC